MAVNSTSWKRFPVAEREQQFKAEDAIVRIIAHASGNVGTFSSAFLWRNSQGEANNKDSYRLPIVDVINGRLTLIPHAVFAAARFMSGAQGGLETTITDEGERNKIKAVLNEIYAVLQKTYGDPRIVPPWLKGRTATEREQEAKAMSASLPVDTQLPRGDHNTQMHISDIDAHTVHAAATSSSHDTLRSELGDTAQHLQHDETVVAAGAPVAPPADWFSNPHLNGPTPLAVTADGRVMGHLAAWNVCHAGIGQQCVMAPRTATGYKYFLNGSVLTADGSTIRVGKITLGTGHADTRLGYAPAADHYDNTGTAAAIVAAGEDQWGIWVAGALTPETSAAKAAELRRSPLSGDWRRINGNLELVAALAVNTPGFPIVSLNASGEPDVLVAAGVILDDGSVFAAAPPEPPKPARAAERLQELEDYIQTLGEQRRRARFRALNS